MRENRRTRNRDGGGNTTLTHRRRAACAICWRLVPICRKPTGDNTIWERQVIANLVAIFPGRQDLLIGPNALPLPLGTVALTFFFFLYWLSQISLHLLLRHSKEARKKPLLPTHCGCSVFRSETSEIAG